MNKMKYLINLNRQQMQNLKTGKFIVLEGLDRSGKSSICQKISQRILSLQNNSGVVITGFPNRNTNIGQMIHQFLNKKIQLGEQAIHLLFSANRWQCINQIKQNLTQGKNVVCDRYWYSGVAYSAAKGLDYEWCKMSDSGLLRPDLIIYLRGDAKSLAKREGFGNQRFENIQFQKKVGVYFDQMLLNEANVKVVEVVDKTLEEITQQVTQIMAQSLNL